jgi:ribonuclease T1
MIGIVAAMLLFGLGIAYAVGPLGDQAEAPRQPSAASQSAAGTAARSGLPMVHAADLPPEAWKTLTLIDSGGPFPYSRDGVVFGNRERLLPRQRSGYYHEYTVPTPGESDRGARRIITGDQGEAFYTGDHYASFREVVR